MVMKKLLLFDFDGVVVDSLEFYESSVNLCLERLGRPRLESRSDFLALFDENFYDGISRRGIDSEAFTKVTYRVAPELDFSTIKIHGDVLDIIKGLKDNHSLSLISSNSTHAIRYICSEVDACFEQVLGYEFMFSKIEKIRHEMERTGIPSTQTFYIGDTLGDIKEAKSAGVQTIAVTWGWHSRERLAASDPDYIIDRPEDLKRLLG
jgi:phosphoglycolate phosphatase